MAHYAYLDNTNTVIAVTVGKDEHELIDGLDTETYYAQNNFRYRDWETDRKSTRLNSSHSAKSRMPSSA